MHMTSQKTALVLAVAITGCFGSIERAHAQVDLEAIEQILQEHSKNRGEVAKKYRQDVEKLANESRTRDLASPPQIRRVLQRLF